MKKSLLLSAALVAAGTAFAAVPAIQKADASAFSAAQPVKTADTPAQMKTRADADVNTMDFTYAGYPSQAFSLNGTTPGVTRVYLAFEMTEEYVQFFKGSKVTGFNMYSPASNGGPNTITDASFFYAFDLKKAAYTQDFTMSSVAASENRIAMDEPYTITGDEEGILFGYSFVVPEEDMAYLITDYTPTDVYAGIFGTSNSDAFPAQFSAFADQIGALCMSVTLEVEGTPMIVKFSSIPSPIYLPRNKKYSIPVKLKSTSAVPIDSFTVEYTLGGKPNTQTFAASTPLPEGMGLDLKVYLDFPAQKELLNENVEFKITKVNGKDNVGEGTTIESDVIVIKEVPVRQTLFEEYTSTTCTWCPRGFAALEYIKKNYPDFVTASFHSRFNSADPMQITTTFPTNVTSFPNGVLNRAEIMDPFYGTQEFMEYKVPIVGDIIELNEIPTVWKIDLTHEWDGDMLVANAEVTNMLGYEDEDYTIAYLLLSDGLSGKTSSWYQTNGYASYAQSSDYPEELNAFCRGGEYGKSRVSGLVFNDVVISATGIYGVEGSVPTSLAAEQPASHSLSFDTSKIAKALIPDKDKLRIVAAILDSKGQVLNCTKDEVNDFSTSAVIGVENADNAPVEYYNLSGVRVAEPAQGIFIRRQGGKAEKVIIR